MEFRFYDEVDPEQVNEIMLMSHGEPADERSVRRVRKADPFCSPWFRMYAVEGDNVVSQVGAAYPEIMTDQGKMTAGFVEAVATRAGHGRKGYANKLMKRVHEQMLDDGIEIFILGTSKTLVAYSMYPKLGYHDIMEFNWAMKKGQRFPRDDVSVKVRKHKAEDGEKMFRRLTKGNYGFVLRPDGYPRAKCSWAPYYSDVVTFYRNDKPIGYAHVRLAGDYMIVREMVCPKSRDYGPCLRALENRYKKPYATRSVIGRPDIADQFGEHGFRPMESWGRLMAMDARGKMTQKQVKELLGADKGNFQIFVLDTY